MGKISLPPKAELDAELAAWQGKEDAMNADENSTCVMVMMMVMMGFLSHLARDVWQWFVSSKARVDG